MGYKGAEIISRIREATGVHNQEALARLMGITTSSISQYKKRDHVPDSWIRWLEKTEGINPAYLLVGEGPAKIQGFRPDPGSASVKVPLVAPHHSRKGGYQPLPDSENWPRFPATWLEGQTKDVSCLLLLRFSGLHMAPELQDGDLVLFDPDKHAPENGKLFAVRIEEAITINRILLGAGVIILRSENRDYPDQEIKRELLGSPQFEVLGKVLGVSRRYV